jgi:hypothetical protein
MGSWSEDPMGNDYAQEWLVNSIAYPLTAAITNAIACFLADGSDDVKKIEAEAAVALLLELTADVANLQSLRSIIKYSACEQGLWDRAMTAIVRLRSDEKWLSAWSNPERKADVLSGIIIALQESKNRG